MDAQHDISNCKEKNPFEEESLPFSEVCHDKRTLQPSVCEEPNATVRKPMQESGSGHRKAQAPPRAPFTHFLTASVSPEEFLDHYHYHYGSNFLFVLISLRWKVKETTSNYCRTQCPVTDDESFLMRGSGIQKKQVKRSLRSSWNLEPVSEGR